MQPIFHSEFLSADRYAHLRELTRLALLRAVAGGRSGRQASDFAFRESVRELCHAAREQGLRVEQLLVALKQCWSELTDEHDLAYAESEERLNGLVTLCIKEYYQPASGD
jgi:hypothetical protein